MLSMLAVFLGFGLAHCFNVPGDCASAQSSGFLEVSNAHCICGIEAPGICNSFLNVPDPRGLGLMVLLAQVNVLAGGNGVTSRVPIH